MSTQHSIRDNARLLPYGATVVFLIFMGIAEHQIRSSPKWPPPARHELGAWEIEDPAIWTFAGALNLPATIPILWAWVFNDSFSYLMDDHSVVIYTPWTFLVFVLWYCVAWRLYGSPNTRRSIVAIVLMQTFITVELLSLALTAFDTQRIIVQKPPIVVIAFFCAWSVATIAGWIGLFRRSKTQEGRIASLNA